nr:MAG: nonstructural polyprotein [Planococcus ficus-associated picorna-like virus 1]
MNQAQSIENRCSRIRDQAILGHFSSSQGEVLHPTNEHIYQPLSLLSMLSDTPMNILDHNKPIPPHGLAADRRLQGAFRAVYGAERGSSILNWTELPCRRVLEDTLHDNHYTYIHHLYEFSTRPESLYVIGGDTTTADNLATHFVIQSTDRYVYAYMDYYTEVLPRIVVSNLAAYYTEKFWLRYKHTRMIRNLCAEHPDWCSAECESVRYDIYARSLTSMGLPHYINRLFCPYGIRPFRGTMPSIEEVRPITITQLHRYLHSTDYDPPEYDEFLPHQTILENSYREPQYDILEPTSSIDDLISQLDCLEMSEKQRKNLKRVSKISQQKKIRREYRYKIHTCARKTRQQIRQTLRDSKADVLEPTSLFSSASLAGRALAYSHYAAYKLGQAFPTGQQTLAEKLQMAIPAMALALYADFSIMNTISQIIHILIHCNYSPLRAAQDFYDTIKHVICAIGTKLSSPQQTREESLQPTSETLDLSASANLLTLLEGYDSLSALSAIVASFAVLVACVVFGKASIAKLPETATWAEKIAKSGKEIAQGKSGIYAVMLMMSDFATWVKKIVCGLKQTAYRNALAYEIIHCDVADDLTNDLKKEDFMEYLKFVMDPANFDDISIQRCHRNKLDFCISIMAAIQQSIVNGTSLLDQAARTQHQLIFSDLKRLKREATKRLPIDSVRMTPCWFYFYGTPQTGKSGLVNLFTNHFMEVLAKESRFAIPDRERWIYSANFCDKYLSNYAAQYCITIDDVFQDTEGSLDNPSAFKLIQWVSNVPHTTEQAAIQDKGMYFDSKVIISTSNDANPDKRKEIYDGKALIERIKLHIELGRKTDLPPNEKLQVPDEPLFKPGSYVRLVPKNTTIPPGLAPEHGFVNFKQLIQVCVKIYVDHFDFQQQLIGRPVSNQLVDEIAGELFPTMDTKEMTSENLEAYKKIILNMTNEEFESWFKAEIRAYDATEGDIPDTPFCVNMWRLRQLHQHKSTQTDDLEPTSLTSFATTLPKRIWQGTTNLLMNGIGYTYEIPAFVRGQHVSPQSFRSFQQALASRVPAEFFTHAYTHNIIECRYHDMVIPADGWPINVDRPIEFVINPHALIPESLREVYLERVREILREWREKFNIFFTFNQYNPRQLVDPAAILHRHGYMTDFEEAWKRVRDMTKQLMLEIAQNPILVVLTATAGVWTIYKVTKSLQSKGDTITPSAHAYKAGEVVRPSRPQFIKLSPTHQTVAQVETDYITDPTEEGYFEKDDFFDASDDQRFHELIQNSFNRRQIVARLSYSHIVDGRLKESTACAVRICGTAILVNYHHMRHLEDGMLMTLIVNHPYQNQSEFKLIFNKRNLVRLGDKDAAVYNCGATVPQAKDIRKHFQTDVVANTTTRCGMLTSSPTPGLYMNLSAKLCTTKEEYSEGSLAHSWQCSMVTLKGQSGSLLVANNNQIHRKILGVATCASKSKGSFFTIITEDELRAACRHLGVTTEIEPVNLELATTSLCKEVSRQCPPNLGNNSMVFLGDVQPKKQVCLPNKTRLMPSIIYDPTLSETEPAVLSNTDERLDEDIRGHSIILRNCEGYDRQYGAVDPRLLQQVTDDIAHEYNHMLTKPTQIKTRPEDITINSGTSIPRRLLSWDQTVNGIPGVLKQIDMDTSPGYPFVLERKNTHLKGKYEWFVESLDECTNRKIYTPISDLLAGLELAEKQLLRGERPLRIGYACLKDEKRSKEKIRKGKTRIFICLNMVYNLLIRKYFGAFIATQHLLGGQISSAVGIDPAKDWKTIYMRLAQKSMAWEDFDYQAWDQSLHPAFFQSYAHVVNTWYGDKPGSPVYLARCSLMDELCHTLIVVKDRLYLKMGGQCSGCAITAEINCVIHDMLMYYCYLRICQKQKKTEMMNLAKFREVAAYAVYGDDIVISIEKSIRDWYNGSEIRNITDELGMNITAADKTMNFQVKTPGEVTFLKRKFIRDTESERILCPIDKKVIEEIPMWVHGKDFPIESCVAN